MVWNNTDTIIDRLYYDKNINKKIPSHHVVCLSNLCLGGDMRHQCDLIQLCNTEWGWQYLRPSCAVTWTVNGVFINGQ